MGGSSAAGATDARDRYARARASAERAIALASHMARSETCSRAPTPRCCSSTLRPASSTARGRQSLRGRNNLPPNLTFDPLFDELRNDPRYAGSAR